MKNLSFPVKLGKASLIVQLRVRKGGKSGSIWYSRDGEFFVRLDTGKLTWADLTEAEQIDSCKSLINAHLR